MGAASPATTAAASPATGATSSTADCPATSTVVPGTAGASVVTADVGKLVSRSDVEAVIGTVSGAGVRVDIPLPGMITTACAWASADGTLAIALGPRNISKADFETFMKLVPGATSITGVGESAFSIKAPAPTGMAGAASIFVLSGGQYFTIQAASRTKSSDSLMTGITDLASKAAKNIP